MREIRDRGERVEIKYIYIYIFFYNTATVQFYLQNCTVASIAKNLQYLPLQFYDVDDFKAANAKFPLDRAMLMLLAQKNKTEILSNIKLFIKHISNRLDN